LALVAIYLYGNSATVNSQAIQSKAIRIIIYFKTSIGFGFYNLLLVSLNKIFPKSAKLGLYLAAFVAVMLFFMVFNILKIVE